MKVDERQTIAVPCPESMEHNFSFGVTNDEKSSKQPEDPDMDAIPCEQTMFMKVNKVNESQDVRNSQVLLNKGKVKSADLPRFLSARVKNEEELVFEMPKVERRQKSNPVPRRGKRSPLGKPHSRDFTVTKKNKLYRNLRKCKSKSRARGKARKFGGKSGIAKTSRQRELSIGAPLILISAFE